MGSEGRAGIEKIIQSVLLHLKETVECKIAFEKLPTVFMYEMLASIEAIKRKEA